MIFYDRVERLKQSDEMDLGDRARACHGARDWPRAPAIGSTFSRGIMKSPWTKADIQHAAARLSEFTALEREAIRLCPWLTRAE